MSEATTPRCDLRAGIGPDRVDRGALKSWQMRCAYLPYDYDGRRS